MGSGQTSDQAYNRQRTLYKQADKSAVTEELVEWEAAREETVEETQNDEEITAEEKKAESSNNINRITIWRMELGSKTSSPFKKNIFVLLYFIKVVLSIMV